MAENSSIQWTTHTFNPWIGCAKVHTGCAACYAEDLMATRYKRVTWGNDGTRVKTKTWGDPVKWNKAAACVCRKTYSDAEHEAGCPQRERPRVFCASLADVFEDRPDLRDWRRDLFRLIDQCQNLDWLLLTKRPENVLSMWYTQEQGGFGVTELTRREFRRDNVWLGTSISDQATAEEYGAALVGNRRLAFNLFLSMEPQIGPVNLRPLLDSKKIDWVIIGGESKQGKHEPRPFNLAWLDKSLEECAFHGVPAFVKQFGTNVFSGDRPVKFADKHGGEMEEWPHEYRVREFPRSMHT